MSAGRTYWLALDARWLAREGVVEAREEGGHAAVTVLLALMGQAKLENDGGHLTTGYRTLAREAFVDGGAEEVSRLVTVCLTAGLLDDLKEHEDGKRFSCRISGWDADQTKAAASVRKARQREQAENPADAGETPPDEPVGQSVTERDKSRPVTECPPTGEDRTGQENSNPPTPEGVKPVRPKWNRKPVDDLIAKRLHRALLAFDAEAGTTYADSIITSTGKWSANASVVLGAIGDHPDLDDTRCVAVIRAGLRRKPYWSGKPEPRHVFGPNVVEGLLADTANGSRGQTSIAGDASWT